MKNLNWLIPFVILLVVSCSGNSSKEEKKTIQEEAQVAFIKPDNHFAEAITNFENGETELVLNKIKAAKNSIQEIIIEGDTVYTSIIETALAQLDTLEGNISQGKNVSVSDLRRVFSKVDAEIARYEVDVVEDWARHGSNNEESLQSMHRAMVRIEYALNHSQIELSEYDSIAVALAKRELIQAEKVSGNLWEKIKSNLQELNRKFDSGTNPMDNS